MSYDLSFYKKKSSSVTKTEISNYLEKLVNSEQRSQNQWLYENKETGSYCSFNYYEPESGANYETENFDDFEATDFSFNINFVRPRFFGEECFPLVEKLADELDLYILNPQMEAYPSKPEKGAMFKNWDENNSSFAEMQFRRMGLKYLEQAKSDYAYHYSLKRQQLQDSLGDEYFVPGIFFLKKHGSDTVETFSIWPESLPYVLPKVDFVLIRRLVGKDYVDGLVRYDNLLKTMDTIFENKDEYHVLHPGRESSTEEKLNTLSFDYDFKSYGDWVAKDSFVNVKVG